MARTVSIGAQNFAAVRERNNFLVDKTDFIRQWWAADDQVTLICRPRRFGKTLNMSMLECFLSKTFAGRSDLFEGMAVWGNAGMRAEQGAWPVVTLSFSAVKAPTFERASFLVRYEIAQAYRSAAAFVDVERLDGEERALFEGT